MEHPRKSICNCPHADGRRVICKHMIALLFTASPEAANKHIMMLNELKKTNNYAEICGLIVLKK